jgi:hypothetical protein
MACVQGLQEIESLAATNLAEYAIGPVPECSPKKVADGHVRPIGLLAPRLQSHQVRLGHLDFGGILNEHHAVLMGHECCQGRQKRLFPLLARSFL